MNFFGPIAPVLAQIDGEERPRSTNWSWSVAREGLPDLIEGMWVTLQITFFALLVAVTLGLVLALLRRARLLVVRWPVGFFVEFVRSTPLLVQLVYLYYFLPGREIALLGLNLELPRFEPTTIAVMALGVHYACYMSESYRAGIQAVPAGQWEASTAINLRSTTMWREVILPQAIPTVIPALGNYLVAAVKDAPLAMVLPSVVTIMVAANEVRDDHATAVESYTLAGLLFLMVSVPLAIFARYLERRYAYERE